MRLVILDAATFGDLPLAPLCSDAHARPHDCCIYPASNADETLARVAQAEILISNKVRVGAREMAAAPALRLINLAATGTNNVDLDEARKRGIAVANVPGYGTSSAAQHTLALYFQLAHRLHFHDHYVKSGAYSQSPIFTNYDAPFHELRGQRWGLLGMGAIGREVARLAEAFGAEVVYHSSSGTNLSQPWPHVSLDELLASARVLSIHAPLNARTQGLIRREQLAKLQPGAILINVARGGIVSERDLAAALADGQPLFAAIDVFEQEPIPANHPFLALGEHPNLLLTPHIAGLSVQARIRLIQEVAANQIAFEKGQSRNRIC